MTCSHPPVREQLSLRSDERAPAAARRFVREAVAGCDPEIAADAELLVSELVSNVVRHTKRNELTVSAETLGDGTFRVEVAHEGRGFLPQIRQRSKARISGWGLEIVDQLASRWGARSAPHAAVWFELGGAQ